MKSYKGTELNLKCRDFRYEVGKEYEVDGDVGLCKNGFHACESPLDVFTYYSPPESRFFEVTQYGYIDSCDDKTVSSKIKLNVELGIIGLCKAHIDWVYSKIKKSNTNTGERSASSNTGDYSAASNTGYCGVAIAWGYKSRAMVGNNTSYLVISDWRKNDDGKIYLHKAYAVRPGDKLERIKIKTNTWYWFEDGKLKKEEVK